MIEIEKPKIETVELNEDAKYGKFVIEPLERGYGSFNKMIRNLQQKNIENGISKRVVTNRMAALW
ncbi:hypothetical protein ACQKJP_28050, partial [Bacillus mobilis]